MAVDLNVDGKTLPVSFEHKDHLVEKVNLCPVEINVIAIIVGSAKNDAKKAAGIRLKKENII